jgi:hypothetical protein
MKSGLIYIILTSLVLLTMVCIIKSENRQRKVPNVNFKLERQINKSNPRKQEMMHIFSNMAVPGWKWDKLYS